MNYDKIVLLHHPKQASMPEVAGADLALLSRGRGQPWQIVKDRFGYYTKPDRATRQATEEGDRMNPPRYDKIVLLRHPKQASMPEIASADLVLLSRGWGQPWQIVKDRFGYYTKPALTVEEAQRLV